MDLEKVFRNLILADLAILVAMVIATATEPEYITALIEQVDQGIYDTGAGMMFALLFLVVYLVNLFMLYKYVSFGKTLYLILFGISIVLSLMAGTVVSSAFQETLAWLGGAVSGAILVLLYYSPIKSKFEK
jgi:hypothetical protein